LGNTSYHGRVRGAVGGWAPAGHWATLARSLFDGVPCSNQLSYWHLRNGSKSPGQARA